MGWAVLIISFFFARDNFINLYVRGVISSLLQWSLIKEFFFHIDYGDYGRVKSVKLIIKFNKAYIILSCIIYNSMKFFCEKF